MSASSGQRVGRKRRFAGWLLFAFAGVIAVLWLASGFWQFNWSRRGTWLCLGRGCLDVAQAPPAAASIVAAWDKGVNVERYTEGPSGFRFRTIDRNIYLGANAEVIDGYMFAYVDAAGMRLFTLPLWHTPLVACTAGVLCMRSSAAARRRAVERTCGACGYSLAGLDTQTPCPECGKVTA